MPFLSARPSRFSFFQVSRLSLRHLALVGLLALFGLSQGFAQATAAPQSHPVASAPAASEEQETAPAKDDASHQGIKVHGHWKIVVKNPDGSVAQTREFENSLVGTFLIPEILAGAVTPGGFGIDITTSGTPICTNAHCLLVPSTSTGVGASICPTNTSKYTCVSGMTQTFLSNSFAGAVQLAGQITASQSGTITNVATQIGICSSNSNFSACSTGTSANAFNFTATTVSAIAVNSGQIVQVTVTITTS